MKRLNNMPIRMRMMVGYGLFMLPLIFLFVTILSSKNSLIDSARQEIAGTRLITSVASAQADLLLGKNNEAASDIADRLARQDLTLGGTVGRPVVDQTLSSLRNAATPRRDASAALVGLIGKLADGANLTLDTDLDSFYVMDATIGKAPAAMDEIAGLADELKSTARQTTLSSDAQVAALLRLARARMQLEGLATSLDTAFNANASGKTRAALAGTLGELQSVTTTALAALEEAMKTRRDHAAQADVIAAPALTALRGFGAAGSAELIRLLEDRVSGLRWALAADLAVSGTLFLIAIGFGFVTIQRGTIRPLIQMTDSMRHLASGDLDAAIPAQDRKDEIGAMAQAMLVFQENGRSARALSEAATREQARKERQQELMAHHTSSFGDAATAIMDSLAAASSVMRTAAGSMTEAANGVHGAATQTATGASAMAQDVTSVASALEEMTASVAEISRQVTTAADMSNQAVARTVTSQESIRALTDSTGRIGEMLGLINQIAGQTNLLALNATIEAARAGDAGRGFAVVAGEVKALAVQTAKATLDIGGQIESVRTATDQAIQAMADIASMIHRMNEASTAISAAVEQQSATAREISGNLHGISTVTAQASSAMGHVETLANQAGELSQNVATSATTIDEEAARLRREVNGFLDAVKQAAHAEAA